MLGRLRGGRTEPLRTWRCPSQSNCRAHYFTAAVIALVVEIYGRTTLRRIRGRKSSRRRAHLARTGARALLRRLNELGALADARRQHGEARGLRRAGQRDRHLHHRPQHQLHERLRRLLQVLRVLPHGEGRGSLRLTQEQIDQKLDELSALGGVQILLQGGHHPEARHRLVPGSAQPHPGKISAHQHPRIQPAASSITSRKSSRCRCAK